MGLSRHCEETRRVDAAIYKIFQTKNGLPRRFAPRNDSYRLYKRIK